MNSLPPPLTPLPSVSLSFPSSLSPSPLPFPAPSLSHAYVLHCQLLFPVVNPAVPSPQGIHNSTFTSPTWSIMQTHEAASCCLDSLINRHRFAVFTLRLRSRQTDGTRSKIEQKERAGDPKSRGIDRKRQAPPKSAVIEPKLQRLPSTEIVQ